MWEESGAYRGTAIDDLWNYLICKCDEEFQREIKPLLELEYKDYIKEFPHIKDVKPNE
ncbi:MAG TPA: hypothetical protein VJH37_03775 [Candidatus Nanoarchaeia archaeon]|nr:hypothetical protein [Candidatus Nanoarchaeia archaeon]